MTLHKKIGSWLTDYGHMVRGSLLMTVHRNPPKHYLEYTIEGKIPVILIPGILGKWGFMKFLGDKISLEGHPVYIIPNLSYNLFSIPASAQILRATVVHLFPSLGHIMPKMHKGAESIKELMQSNNITAAVLVAHSKGGLIGKYYLTHHNQDHRVLGMVSIATPYSGSAMAKLIPLDPFAELKNDSELIKDLERHTEANHQIISILPEYDNHVWAEKGSYLEGAENVEVPIRGHHKVLFSKQVVEVILASINKLTLIYFADKSK